MVKVKRIDVMGNINDYKMDNGNQIGVEWFSFNGTKSTMVNVIKWDSMESDIAEQYKVHLKKEYCLLEVIIYEKGSLYPIYNKSFEISPKQSIRPQKRYILDRVIKAIYLMEGNK